MRAALLSLVVLAGCAGAGPPAVSAGERAPLDVAIVPGCPSEEDGSLSRCQLARAIWAARQWDEGRVSNFITSGAAVHSRYVEAEALAAALAALGVPPERIWLEPNALHTDENMVYSLQIARALGWKTVAVASNGAEWDCKILVDWSQPCTPIQWDLDWVKARHRQVADRLDPIRTAPVVPWVPIAERERQIASASGRHRPPSYLLYPRLSLMRLNHERWIPPGLPAEPTRQSWAMRTTKP